MAIRSDTIITNADTTVPTAVNRKFQRCTYKINGVADADVTAVMSVQMKQKVVDASLLPHAANTKVSRMIARCS